MFNRSLTALDVRSNALGDGSSTLAVAEAVATNEHIVMFCEIPVKKLRDDVVTELDLKGRSIGTCGALVVARLLEFSRALKSANLAENEIGDQGAIAISAALESNTSLTKLDLSAKGYGPMIGIAYGTMISTAGAQAIAKMLVVNRALTSLNLRNNAVWAGGAKAIAAALPQS